MDNKSDDLATITNKLKSHDNLLIASTGLAIGLSFFSRRLSCITTGFGGFLNGKRCTMLEKQNDAYEHSQKNSIIKRPNPYMFLNSLPAHNTINFLTKAFESGQNYYTNSGAEKIVDTYSKQLFPPK